MAKLFGTSGARGKTNKDIDPELALKIGFSLATRLSNRLSRQDPPTILVGHDNRYGAEMLYHAAIAGCLSAGARVVAIGCVSTGMMSAYLTCTKGDGAILITGSHMGPERIGIIPLLPDARYCPMSFTDILAADVKMWPVRMDPAPEFSKLHGVEYVGSHAVRTRYLDDVARKLDVAAVHARRFKVLVDPGNGTGTIAALELFRMLGCEVNVINGAMKPIPDRPSECRKTTCTQAIEMMRSHTDTDLCVCVDGDADRALIIMPGGEALSEDTVGALLALHLLKSGDACVAPINSSGLITWVCSQVGAKLHMCAVGQPAIGEAIIVHRARFAYEESGKYFVADQQCWTDGLFTAAKLLELMVHECRSLVELVSELPVFHQVKRQIALAEDLKAPVFAAVQDLLKTRLREQGDRDTTVDGFRRDFFDGSWVVVRLSGTEPSIRVMSDALFAERADALADLASEIVLEALTAVSPCGENSSVA